MVGGVDEAGVAARKVEEDIKFSLQFHPLFLLHNWCIVSPGAGLSASILKCDISTIFRNNVLIFDL